MKKYLILTVTLLCGLASACSETGVPVEYGKACTMENDKKTIEVAGFLDIKGSILCSNTGGGPVRCGLKLKESPQAEKGFSADIEKGTGANTVDDPKASDKREDMKIRDAGGNPINLAEKVKLTGKLNTVPDGNVCYLTVSKIEKQ